MKPSSRTLAFLGCLLIGLFSAGTAAAGDGWRWYNDPQWGYRVEYPAYLFAQPDPADERGGLTLQTTDGRAKLLFFAGPNRLELDTKGVAKELAKADARVVTYKRVADNWVVLSGYVDQGLGDSRDMIFYERVSVSSERRAMAGFRLEYPADKRPEIDHLIGRIGRSLTAPREAVALGRPVSPAGPAESAATNSSNDGLSDGHTARCRAKYPSYDEATDTFRRFDGVRVPCSGVSGDQ